MDSGNLNIGLKTGVHGERYSSLDNRNLSIGLKTGVDGERYSSLGAEIICLFDKACKAQKEAEAKLVEAQAQALLEQQQGGGGISTTTMLLSFLGLALVIGGLVYAKKKKLI